MRKGHLWDCKGERGTSTCTCDPREVRYIEARDALDVAMSVRGGTSSDDAEAMADADRHVLAALEEVRAALSTEMPSQAPAPGDSVVTACVEREHLRGRDGIVKSVRDSRAFVLIDGEIGFWFDFEHLRVVARAARGPGPAHLRCHECGEMMTSHVLVTRHAAGPCEETFTGPELGAFSETPSSGAEVTQRQIELTSLADLADVIVWMSGSSDFAPEGKAGPAWRAWGYPRLDRALKVLKRIPESTSVEQTTMKPVVIESPYAGDIPGNLAYATAAVLDCLKRGEAPYASHLFFTQMLDDADPPMRKLGMQAGFAIGMRLDTCVVYIDRGISGGMVTGIRLAINARTPIEFRSLERHIHPSEYPGFIDQCTR